MHETSADVTNQPAICCLFPWLELGGADKFNLDMIGQLAARGWRVSIITTLPANHAWRAPFAAQCDDIVDIGALPAGQQTPALLRALLERQPDVVLVSHSDLGYAALPLMRVQLPRAACVDYCHIVEADVPGYPAMSVKQRRFLDLQIVSSEHVRGWMLAHGAEPERMRVCTTNIDTAEWNPACCDRMRIRAELDIAPDAPLVLYAGRLERQKQPMLALHVLRKLINAAPETHALVAGEGKFGTYLRRSLRRWRMERHVQMLGAVSNERMRELLAASDIFFLPSEMEGISLAIYEAMAMGVVPVSAAVGGQPELVTPDCGVLVQRGPNEQADYTAALLRLIRAPRMLRAMGQRARQRVQQHFTLDSMGNCMHAALQAARQLAATEPRSCVTAEDVAAALAESERIAQHDADIYRSQTQVSPRTRMRNIYWHMFAEHGWWLLPYAEQARSKLRELRT
jgi:glycosyltransferase involved in cell wall biosynthesis